MLQRELVSAAIANLKNAGCVLGSVTVRGFVSVAPCWRRLFLALAGSTSIEWYEVARKVLGRLRCDLGGAQARSNADDALLSEAEPLLAQMGVMPVTAESPPLMVGVRLRRGELALNLFTTITTLGTAQDVTLQEIRIETLFPADATTKQVLAAREAGG